MKLVFYQYFFGYKMNSNSCVSSESLKIVEFLDFAAAVLWGFVQIPIGFHQRPRVTHQ